jgi:hypothetical protein
VPDEFVTARANVFGETPKAAVETTALPEATEPSKVNLTHFQAHSCRDTQLEIPMHFKSQ